ncbi:unnamed protein product [Psylliodes chrysocephalus]|uniref:Lipase n=1 Tax=Psylliodes chrysocephalus TaxID=3402493 RepID=A0A9P0CKX6_9CUCU|nr:unnamed protein product [Psylliodes chrysocephala]
MVSKILLIFVLTYAAVQSQINNPEEEVGGVIGTTPELVTDIFGNVLDINNIPTVPFVPVPQLISNEGYPSENHYVTTTDGYILNLHRIPRGKNGTSNGKVVLLQHGLLLASSDWVLLGPKNGLAYILADEGYDVWLPNSRGNRYSRNHTTLSPESSAFWQFSFNEMGRFDIPNTIDYILAQTQQTSLFHIGHSQGTTSFYVMNSLRPEYNSKIKAHISLAPVAYMNNLVSPLVRLFAPGASQIGVLLQLVGEYEFLPDSGFVDLLLDPVCSIGVGKVLCKNVLFAINGFSPEQMNVSNVPLFFANYPAGAATKQLVHYGQEVNTANFEKFDNGLLGNLQAYNSIFPPDYNISKITAPVHFIYASNDFLAAVVDVQRLYSQLPNGQELYNVPLQTFNHLDFLFGINATNLVYDRIKQILASY